MLKPILIALLPFLVMFSNGTDPLLSGVGRTTRDANSGTLEKMIVESGSVSMNMDLSKLGVQTRSAKSGNVGTMRLAAKEDSFFTILVFNNELRGPMPSSMDLVTADTPALPGKLAEASQRLVLENQTWEDGFNLVVRDGKTGFIFFRVDGQQYSYNPINRELTISDGRLVVTPEFANALRRPDMADSIIGTISVAANMRTVEASELVDGQMTGEVMPPARPSTGTNPGPDVIVGDLSGLAQYGNSANNQVGLAVGTDSCNMGTENLHWFQTPDNDHPVIPQNLYRMSGGASNDQTFEQIGQSSVKHAFLALTNNICNLGCNGVGGSNLGSGCSDPYSASLNSGPSLGSRAWVNPFTGAFPRADSATPPNNHNGHTHDGTSHRILVNISDLNTAQNPGATYYAEGQYITPHEYSWCAAHPGQCNMYNNVSYRQYSVSGTNSPFAFSPVSSTQRMKAAINAWTGATQTQFEPDPGHDGIGVVAYKVTNPSPGVWHYEYAIYNQNLDRAVQSFSVPTGSGVTLSNVGFHAPPQQPGWANDGTQGSAGFSSTPWAQDQSNGAMTWSTETLAQNPNANAIRWGTLYNFRFDSNSAPQTVQATLGFLKTGAPITVSVPGPSAATVSYYSVSGRVTTTGGAGIGNERVFITAGGNGFTQFAITNPFGYFTFQNVPAGAYVVGLKSKLYQYDNQSVNVADNIADLSFTPNP